MDQQPLPLMLLTLYTILTSTTRAMIVSRYHHPPPPLPPRTLSFNGL